MTSEPNQMMFTLNPSDPAQTLDAPYPAASPYG